MLVTRIIYIFAQIIIMIFNKLNISCPARALKLTCAGAEVKKRKVENNVCFFL